jgi:hypothetical protein
LLKGKLVLIKVIFLPRHNGFNNRKFIVQNPEQQQANDPHRTIFYRTEIVSVNPTGHLKSNLSDAIKKTFLTLVA